MAQIDERDEENLEKDEDEVKKLINSDSGHVKS